MAETERRAQYMRVWRAENPEVVERDSKARSARAVAGRRLAERYPEEFAELLAEEREKRGLPPVGVMPRGRRPASR